MNRRNFIRMGGGVISGLAAIGWLLLTIRSRPLTITIIAVLLAAAIYALVVGSRLRIQMRQLWRALRAHRLVAGLLTLYSVIAGILLVTCLTAPREIVLLTLPIAAGVCGVWWEVRQASIRPFKEQILDRDILAGLLVVALPVLCIGILQGWLAGREGELAVTVAAWTAWKTLLLWVEIILGMGIVIGVFGAFISIWFSRLPDPCHRGGPQRPAM